MEKAKSELQINFNRNTVVLKDLRDSLQDMRRYLTKRDTIIYVDCHNLTIRIESTINRLEFKNCENISVYATKLISGIVTENCKNICLDAKNVGSVQISKSSDIDIKSRKEVYSDIYKSYHVTLHR